jgi:hypothetical protein
MRALPLALAALTLCACGLIDAFENSDNATVDCDDEICFCREPDESEEGASCIGGRASCVCDEGFLDCQPFVPCTIEYPDGGCAALDCGCDVLGESDGCTCDGETCTGAGEDNIVRSDLGGGCIGAACECITGTCSCEPEARCRLETQGVLCNEIAECELFAGAESTGCFSDGDCESNQVCVVANHVDVGALGYCFLAAEGGDICTNGSAAVTPEGFGATSAFCPRATGLGQATCEDGACRDLIVF